MSAKGYTTKEKLENYLLKDIDSSFSTQIDEWIDGVERIIDQITGRNFKADSSVSARVFDGDDTNELLIDDCVEVTLVEAGQDSYGGTFETITSTGSSRYFLDPANYSAKGVPITKITLNGRIWGNGKQNHRITAKWGYSTNVPKDIEFVATVFLAGVLNQHMLGGNQIKTEKIGNYSVTYNTDDGNDSWADFEQAKMILESYRKINI